MSSRTIRGLLAWGSSSLSHTAAKISSRDESEVEARSASSWMAVCCSSGDTCDTWLMSTYTRLDSVRPPVASCFRGASALRMVGLRVRVRAQAQAQARDQSKYGLEFEARRGCSHIRGP